MLALDTPIDIVYTFVDNKNPKWQKEFKKTLAQYPDTPIWATCDARFDPHNDLRYSLRSLQKYVPFIRNVYIITDGHVPEWLNQDADNLHIVTHKEIFENDGTLPTFNSVAIESILLRIKSLSNVFLYANDDTFFCSPCKKEDFVDSNGHVKIRLTKSTHSHSRTDWANTWHATCRIINQKLGNFPADYFPAPEDQEERLFCSPDHIIQPYNKQSMEIAFTTFRNEIESVITSQFRKEKMYITPVIYQFYSMWNKSAVPIWLQDSLTIFRTSSNPIFERLKEEIQRTGKLSYFFLCLNDAIPDPNHDTWVEDVENLLGSLFPEPSKYEK